MPQAPRAITNQHERLYGMLAGTRFQIILLIGGQCRNLLTQFAEQITSFLQTDQTRIFNAGVAGLRIGAG